MDCDRHSNWMLTSWTLTHPKSVPNTRTPSNGEYLLQPDHHSIYGTTLAEVCVIWEGMGQSYLNRE